MANSTTVYQLSSVAGLQAVDVTENKTLTLADQGIVQNVKTDAIVVTLPSTSAGATFYIRNGGVTAVPAGASGDGSVLVAVSPAAADKIQGLAFTAADNKDALNTKTTSRIGDYLKIVGDGVDGWNVVENRGVWTREA